MKQLLIFLILIILSLGIDLKPLNLDRMRSDSIRITVSGAVQNPGLFTMPLYSSVQDVLNLCSPDPAADLSRINPQMILKDRDVLCIPEIQPEPLVSINTAAAEELQTLPGIGPGTAQRIIHYREENGLFQELQDLMRVKGIGPGRYEALKERICL
jgi:competence protein ComEA